MKGLKLFSIIALISIMVCSLCACAAPRTQPPTQTAEASATPTAIPTLTLTPTVRDQENLQVFEEVWSTVNATYFDPNFGGLDWDAIHDEYAPLIIAAEDDETLYQLLNQMLWELNVSHTGVGPADEWLSVEPVVWGAGEIGIELRLLVDQAVITRLKAGSSAEAVGIRVGFVIQSIEGIPVEQIIAEMQGHLGPPYNPAGQLDGLTRHLLGLIYGDPGTCVTLAFLDEKDELQEGCIQRIQRPRKAYMAGIPIPPSYLEVESGRLESGVGYIRFNTFHPDLVADMTAAVAALQDAPGIIIDLRGNPGGDPSVAEALAAQFLDGQVPFGSFKVRSGNLERLVTGKNVYTGSLAILIDALSYSASEHFASGMQALGRAVIIGERSPGGATGMNVTTLPNDAIFGYPVAQLISLDGTVLEGYGIIPNIIVPLERGQLLEGIDAQLQAAIDYIVENKQ